MTTLTWLCARLAAGDGRHRARDAGEGVISAAIAVMH